MFPTVDLVLLSKVDLNFKVEELRFPQKYKAYEHYRNHRPRRLREKQSPVGLSKYKLRVHLCAGRACGILGADDGGIASGME